MSVVLLKLKTFFIKLYFYKSLRDLEDFGKFSRFLTPTPSRRQFFTTIRRQIWPIFDPSLPLKNADVLNGWSLSYLLLLKLGS